MEQSKDQIVRQVKQQNNPKGGVEMNHLQDDVYCFECEIYGEICEECDFVKREKYFEMLDEMMRISPLR